MHSIQLYQAKAWILTIFDRIEGTLGGKPVSAEVDPYFLINVGLGGQVQSADFFNRLDTTQYSLAVLLNTIKYKIFKVLKEQ